MKKLFGLVLMALATQASAGYEHSQSTEASKWSDVDKYQPANAVVPITIHHKGDKTDYVITVNNRVVSNVFSMEGKETLRAEVPVTLKDKHGAQEFIVCSQSLNHKANTGANICNRVELFNLYPSED